MLDIGFIFWILPWIAGLIVFVYLIHVIPTVLQLMRVTLFSEKVDLKQRYGDWAVITGASDGIGKSYAAELASRGINIALVARNRKKMQEVALELEKQFGVRTHLIVADFSEGRSIYDSIKEALGKIQVGILVNNVGIHYAYPMAFADVPEDSIWDHIYVNMAAATMMTRIVLPKMIEDNKGAIVNISSMSSQQPQPYLILYAATKAYLTIFSDALREEVMGTNVTIQTLVPAYIATKINHFAPSLLKESFFIPNVDTYVSHAVNTLGKIDSTTGYWPHRIQWTLFINLVPYWCRAKFLCYRYKGYGQRFLKKKLQLQGNS